LSVSITSAGGVREAALGLSPLVVGSGAECDLVVDDSGVSRRHCALTLTERGIVLSDLGSKNGTLADGIEILEARITSNVVVHIGNARMVVHVPRPPGEVAISTAARFGDVIGGSIAMRELFARLEMAAQSDETILLTGETGTGKELLARAIHVASPR